MVDGPSSPELIALRTFLAVYRSGAVGKAAELLHLSQPAVSHHLRTLEHSLGRPLFVRAGRGVRATGAGHALAAEIGGHVDALGRAITSFRQAGDGMAGPVFLGSPGDLLAEMVLPKVGALVENGITLRCRLGLPPELLEDLLANRLDIAVLSKIEGASKKDLHLVLWRQEQFVLVGRAGAAPYDPQDKTRAFIGYGESMPMARRYFRLNWNISPPIPVVTAPDMRAVVRAVEAGIGLAVAPLYLVEQSIQRHILEVLHEPSRPVTNSLYLATRRGHEAVPRVRSVFAHLLGDARDLA